MAEALISPEEASRLEEWEKQQILLKDQLITTNTESWQQQVELDGLERVGGVDLSYIKGEETVACASLVVLSYPEMEVIYEDCHMVTLDAPYVAGFLAFREVPSLVEAVKSLQEKKPDVMPQVLLVDGNGILHHRGFGVACHLGILTDLPTIGVAKNLLQVDGLENNEAHKEQLSTIIRAVESNLEQLTEHLTEEEQEVRNSDKEKKHLEGKWKEKAKQLEDGEDYFHLKGSTNQILGAALKSCKKSSKPIYVSVGHKISLETAVNVVRSCCKYRVPEPTRQADIRSREFCMKITNKGKTETTKSQDSLS